MVSPVTLSFTWTFKGFSRMKSGKSDVFSLGLNNVTTNWCLKFQTSVDDANGEYVYLTLSGEFTTPQTGDAATVDNVRFTVCIVDVFNNHRNSKSDFKQPPYSYCTCQFAKYIFRSELISKGLLISDTLTILSTIEIGSSPDGDGTLQKPQEMNFNPEFLDMYLQHKNTDTTIKVKTAEFKTHKFVLSAHSEVFAAMFSHDMKESSTNTVTIDDIEPDVFEELLRFMYSNQVQNMSTIAKELYTCADKYSMGRLKVLCEKGIKENLSISNAVEYLAFADAYNANSLKSIISTYIGANIKSISAHVGWNYLIDHPQLVQQVMDCAASEIDRLVNGKTATR